METKIYSSANISFDCFFRECNKLKETGAGKLNLEPVIKEMLSQGVTRKNGDIMCLLGDSTCKNKLFYDITIEKQ
ncbi:hypothetical protein Dtox_2922 [Desulfofarcimen acetoxidans DSM 771]|jgi:hypothetical protein|uniref:Uncharacterized protein n=1 Tax=Desulfofarcimen acetoxidans (strain ATCC 49208 / DSM 771 / KCTC 5769 / VKM B-1644 / 5575) TaxID=485916 RepID=C8W2J4_DESAS|nr:hypothetical protein [Desulfofarcimen acetoxidans]ACV63678.1 hypothetical protein Dtox_2922 [Desulfofarcimen acetoxidans DSM 771]